MIWSILVATHASRGPQFARLTGMLASQLCAGIEVVVYWNRGGRGIGEYRQALVEDARGEYTSFIDDDDRVPDYYCEKMMLALAARPDVVGFETLYTDLSHLHPRASRVFNSIRYDGYYQKGGQYYRDVTHLNPVRRELALKVSFAGGPGEDHRWSKQIRPLLSDEVYVDRVMYFYDFNRADSHHQPLPDSLASRPVLDAPFRFHPSSDSEEE